jgi:hypothetical protein
VSYGPSRTFEAKRIAGYVEKIIAGEKPEDLPIETPTKFELETAGYPAWYPAHGSFGQVPHARIFARQKSTGRMNPRGRLRISRHAGCARLLAMTPPRIL